MDQVAEVDTARHTLAVDERVLRADVVVDDLRAQAAEPWQHIAVEAIEEAFDLAAPSRFFDVVEALAQPRCLHDVPEQRVARRRMKETAQRAGQPSGRSPDLAPQGGARSGLIEQRAG